MVNLQTSWEVRTLSQRASEALAGGQLGLTTGYLFAGLAGLAVFLAAMALVLVYAERKIAAHFQCRLGPMRVGWHGILQSVADSLKLLLKEDIVPTDADRFLHVLAPFMSLLAAILVLVMLPMSPALQVADVNIGVLYVTAVSGLGALGILLGGWSSNNKWSLLGAMRAGAQIISYEVSATLSLLVVVLFSGTLQLSKIVQSQADGWWIWRAPGVGLLAFAIYLIASVAEINRTPFDISEGESELTAGFHTEYSGMRFAFFFLAEFINMFVVSALAATLFLGGWMPFHIGGLATFNAAMDLIPPGAWFAAKSAFLIFVIMWFRWTFPRLRIDQLMRLEWKILLPIGFVNLFLAAMAVLFGFYFFPVQ
ncbi:MAG: NADH-quinone oxidoreductase subunit NuoH [Deltaproteobacteria bacterium]|nr:NADH-quinone oxidoreductase subunit NuoH [Deltaproteobacteria bacterium]